jgi:Bacterial SH3 domain
MLSWGMRTALACLPLLVPLLPCAAQDIRRERVEFRSGASGATLAGSIAGDAIVDYVLDARAGQRMQVDLTTSNPSLYFNVIAPGADSAMFVGSVEGAHFAGALPASGEQVIRVYLMRNAARRGEKAEYSLNVEIGGAAAGAPVPAPADDFADGLAGGPDFWEVTGLEAGGTLNLRGAPSTGDAVLARLPAGEVVRNRGCRMAGGQRWCEVVRQDGGSGWVAGRYLREAAAPAAATAPAPPRRASDAGGLLGNGEPFSATGSLPCVLGAGQPTASCRFGVIRTTGQGNAGIWIARGDGTERYILFENGAPVFTDAGASPALERNGDLNLVRIGDERYEIPDAVLNGG